MQASPSTTPGPGRTRWNTTTRWVVGILILIAAVWVAYMGRAIFAPLVIGAVIAYLLYPVAQFVARVTRLSHGLSALIVYILLIGLLVPGGLLAAPLLSEQFEGLRGQLNGFLDYLRSPEALPIVVLPGIELNLQSLVGGLGGALENLVRSAPTELPNLLFGASKTFLLVIFTVFIGYYMTADAQKIVGWLKRLIPRDYRADADVLLADINQIWAAFFRGQAVLALVVTVIMTALSFAIGLPQPLVMGLLAGVLEFLVSVGHTIWLIIALALALTQGSTFLPVSNVVFALIVVGTNLVFTKVDLNVLIPAIVGSRVRLHPMVVLIGIIVGASVGGVLGIALAAPTIASLRILGRYVYAQLFDEEPEPAPVVEAAQPVKAAAPKAKQAKSGEGSRRRRAAPRGVPAE